MAADKYVFFIIYKRFKNKLIVDDGRVEVLGDVLDGVLGDDFGDFEGDPVGDDLDDFGDDLDDFGDDPGDLEDDPGDSEDDPDELDDDSDGDDFADDLVHDLVDRDDVHAAAGDHAAAAVNVLVDGQVVRGREVGDEPICYPTSGASANDHDRHFHGLKP